ncbi:hypothetical protein [Methylobacterium radiotolerans]|uniref:Uncharacterized protein n=1 Tax=Methylobacterium radiotolerans (strain ATCC 27329 / DSM 1819 / JCM 2831 / NBRC 15690 / NCIMB 10815 / 0-1) TaxID=426355 RepID=B1M7J5_METRJ|nr:hypothetical protein [Methylobacterium radiotolerans]ACB23720.1 hypothetical protein Mrad2831_1725 [Methylobacterium radiotolerans JCM 2831]GEM97792.1 hypothetical protein MRA01_23320 [Methylobacterium radiotolerans]
MSELQRLLSDPRFRSADKVKRGAGAAPEPDLGNVLRAVASLQARTESPTPPAAPRDWDALINRVQTAARQARAIEAQAREREARIEQVLDQVREEIHASNERARMAEMQAREVQLRAEAQVAAAEERAKAAEARARTAEDRARQAEEWLDRVQQAILSEFSDLTEQAAA